LKFCALFLHNLCPDFCFAAHLRALKNLSAFITINFNHCMPLLQAKLFFYCMSIQYFEPFYFVAFSVYCAAALCGLTPRESLFVHFWLHFCIWYLSLLVENIFRRTKIIIMPI